MQGDSHLGDITNKPVHMLYSILVFKQREIRLWIYWA